MILSGADTFMRRLDGAVRDVPGGMDLGNDEGPLPEARQQEHRAHGPYLNSDICRMQVPHPLASSPSNCPPQPSQHPSGGRPISSSMRAWSSALAVLRS